MIKQLPLCTPLPQSCTPLPHSRYRSALRSRTPATALHSAPAVLLSHIPIFSPLAPFSAHLTLTLRNWMHLIFAAQRYAWRSLHGTAWDQFVCRSVTFMYSIETSKDISSKLFHLLVTPPFWFSVPNFMAKFKFWWVPFSTNISHYL